MIAEVGSWCNPLDSNPIQRAENRLKCIRQLELAEYIRAACCVNIVGTTGEVWDGSYAENYSAKMYEDIVLSLRDIIDAVKPQDTKYTAEPMPHMLPDSPESYLQLLHDVDRRGFGVHLDAINMVSSPRIYFDSRGLIDRCFDLSEEPNIYGSEAGFSTASESFSSWTITIPRINSNCEG